MPKTISDVVQQQSVDGGWLRWTLWTLVRLKVDMDLQQADGHLVDTLCDDKKTGLTIMLVESRRYKLAQFGLLGVRVVQI